MQTENASCNTLTASQLNIYQQLFSLFDKQDSGCIPISSVPIVSRGMGHCPTEREMNKILEELGHPQAKEVEFKKLVNVLEKRKKQQNIEEELLTAFTNIQSSFTSSSEANKSEQMQINLIKKQLTELGQPFSQSEWQGFNQFINSTNGLKFYEQEFNFRNLSKILSYGYIENN